MPRLTAASVERIKRTGRRQEVRDTLCPGLVLVVQPTGTKSWQVRYRASGVQRRLTFGQYGTRPPGIDLAAAREKARDLMVQIAAGEDPAAPASEPDRDTVAALVEQYARRHLSELKSGATVKRELDRHFVSRFGPRDIHEVSKRDLIELLDTLVDSGRATSANRLRAYLSTFFGWLVQRDVIDVSPVMGIKRPAKEVSRDRVLSDAELRWLWKACEALGEPWGPFAQMLLLTGQRRGEVAGMTDAELAGEVWQIPASRTKNGRAHTVPLSEAALLIVNRPGRIEAPFMFSARGGHLGGFHKGLGHLQHALREEARKEAGRAVDVPAWTLHDLRRTAATGMARLGLAVHVVEAVLNHASGAVSGVAGVYNRHAYDAEKRQALDAWARFVGEIVEGKAGNVVRLEATR